MDSWHSGKPCGLAIRETWVQPVVGGGPLGKLLDFLDPQFPYKLLWRWNKILYLKVLATVQGWCYYRMELVSLSPVLSYPLTPAMDWMSWPSWVGLVPLAEETWEIISLLAMWGYSEKAVHEPGIRPSLEIQITSALNLDSLGFQNYEKWMSAIQAPSLWFVMAVQAD